MDDAQPSNPPSYTFSDLPTYTRNVQPNERTVDTAVAASSALNVIGEPVQEFEYKIGRLKLNLGPKKWGLFRPAFGWNDSIDGFVEVKGNTKNVTSLVVSVEGYVTTGRSERGFLTEQTKTRVLQLSQTLFDESAGQHHLIGATRYPFSFSLPSYIEGGMDLLPPTFAGLHPGVGADVTYYVKVDMLRKGMLRQNGRVKAFFYYLPRTYAPLPQCRTLASDDAKTNTDDSSEWRVFPVLPKLPRGMTSSSASNLSVSLALPRPLIYAAGSSIPFLLTVTSGTTTEALPSLFSCLSVQLIRVTTLMAGERRSQGEASLGGGEVFRVEERENARMMFGTVTCVKEGEASWRVAGIEVKYIIRVRLAPRGDVPSLACALPTYVHEEVVTLKTHEQTWATGGDDGEATTPALCRAPRAMMGL